VLQRLKAGFERRWNTSSEFRSKMQGKDRDIVIDLGQDGVFHLVVRNGFLEQILPGRPEKVDASVTLAAADLVAIFNNTLHPIKAYTTGRVKVKAPLRDILLVRAFLGG